MTASETLPSEATRFVNDWMSKPFGTAAQHSDAADFAASLEAARNEAGFNRAALEAAAGRALADAIEFAATRRVR